jgi:hypothetical protein
MVSKVGLAGNFHHFFWPKKTAARAKRIKSNELQIGGERGGRHKSGPTEPN